MSHPNSDDIILLQLIRQGDKLAFKHLFDTYFTPLCRFVHSYIADTTVAEELVLDIFTYLWENRRTLQIHLSFKAYLFQAARNKCLNELRQKRRFVSLDEVSGELSEEMNTFGLEADELYHLIREAVMALPDKCRDVFRLSREENFTNKEIAEHLQISPKTVEAQITKALKRIKAHLGDAYSYLW